MKEEPKHQPMGFFCTECYLTFHEYKEIERHSHQEGYSFLCVECGENFVSNQEIVNHAKEHGFDDGHNIEERIHLADEKPYQQLPKKSKSKYETTYQRFMNWILQNNAQTLSENVIIAYLKELSKELKPSTLWTTYSMLKTMLKLRNNIDISTYTRCLSFLKFQSSGYKCKKSLTLTSEQIKKFLLEAPDQEYLFTKVLLIFGVSGGCGRKELRNLKVNHVRDLGDEFQVKVVGENTKKERLFVVSGKFYELTKKYVLLRPPKMEEFFVNYKNGKCFRQIVGVNKIGNQPKVIAQFLKLPNPNLYTGHCFRRSGPL